MMKLYPLNSFPRYFLALTFLIFILYHLNDGACHNMPNPPPLLAWRHLWFSFKGFIKSAPCSPLPGLWVWTRPGGDSPHWHLGWCPTSPTKFVRRSDQKKLCSALVRRLGTKVDLNPPGKKRQVGIASRFAINGYKNRVLYILTSKSSFLGSKFFLFDAKNWKTE